MEGLTMTSKALIARKRTIRGIKDDGIQDSRRKAITNMVSQTQQPQSEYAYCAIPDGFFDRLTLRKKLEIDRIDTNERTLFSVRTWDGREVMKIESVA
jgi:hypothetical protein